MKAAASEAFAAKKVRQTTLQDEPPPRPAGMLRPLAQLSFDARS
jgi:hypothetical protein